jgi:hypothetical protein
MVLALIAPKNVNPSQVSEVLSTSNLATLIKERQNIAVVAERKC